MNRTVANLIEQKKGIITEKWLIAVKKVKEESNLENISYPVYTSTNQQFVEVILNAFTHNQEDFDEQLKHFTDRLIIVGWPLSYFTRGLQLFRKVILDTLMIDNQSNEKNMDTYYEVDTWIDQIINILVTEYTGSWESIVNLQKMALKELSAPLIPIFDDISVMPLIGPIDTERAKLIIENLLKGVIEHRSQVVLIDITGVPVVDTMVANHIIQASEAVRLIGAQCILVGIRPELAQTIVNLGIDLSKFPTKSTLRRGIEKALERTKKKIVHIEKVRGD